MARRGPSAIGKRHAERAPNAKRVAPPKHRTGLAAWPVWSRPNFGADLMGQVAQSDVEKADVEKADVKKAE
jgi:hypothetical protein